MPIIIDNFQVNINAPIDNRFVVGGSDSFYSHRNDIVHKYQGLRIWDLNDNVPYYWDGTNWVSENAIGVSADVTADINYIAKFTTGSTIIGKSLLYENISTGQIGLGIIGSSISANTTFTGTSLNNAGGLHVAGNIKTNYYFIGNGHYITDINASNINSGSLNVQYISSSQAAGFPQVSLGQYVLFNTGTVNGVSWLATNTLTVLNSTNTTNVNIIDDTSTPIVPNNYITFVQHNSGNLPIYTSSGKIQFNPGTGQLFLGNGDVNNPVYSFINNTNTGFYYNQGISTTIQGNEVTSIKTFGVIVNNRIYLPTSSNNTDVGYGIVWSINGNSTNNTSVNDGFVYNGQRLNYYGLGSHIPTSLTTGGRGTYIAGYFGIDLFSGGNLKVKVDDTNDVTINSRLNIVNTFDTLGGSTGNNIVLSTIKNMGGSTGNNIVIKDWSVRSNTGTDWLTWKHHNGITIDGVYNTPNGADNGSVSTSGTLTFWERFPYIHEQYFGSVNRRTLTINSGISNQFVKVDGNLLVGGLTTQITNSNGNIVVGNGNLLVGTNTIITSAMVDFTSTTKGFLPPRMSTIQRNTITSPVEGLIIYNNDTTTTLPIETSHKKTLNTYDGSKWIGMVPFLYRGTTTNTFDCGATDVAYTIWFTKNGPILTTGPNPATISNPLVDIGTNKYIVIGTLEAQSTSDYSNDNDVIWMIGQKFNNSFVLVMREISTDTQVLKFSFYILPNP